MGQRSKFSAWVTWWHSAKADPFLVFISLDLAKQLRTHVAGSGGQEYIPGGLCGEKCMGGRKVGNQSARCILGRNVF